MNSALYLLDGNDDIKISDVGVKPSGEPFINTEFVRNEMTKYFNQMREMTDQEFADAKEAERLANHPEKDKLIAIQNLIAKEKGLKEVDLEEYSSGPFTKAKLLAYLGQADDAMIRTHDDKYLIIYNPKNGNDDNANMWKDDSVFAVDQDGEEHEVVGKVGQNLLRLGQKYDIPLEGACEGVCACSTCHVILENEIFDSLPYAEDEEEDMLDLAWGLTPTSRLGCQIELTEEMAGMKIKLPTATRNFYVDGHVPEPH